MASEWRECLLGDVVELKRGYDLPQQHRQVGKIEIISSSGPSGFHSEAKVKAPGVVTGRYGTLGEVFYVNQDFWPLNTTLYVRDFKGNDPRFISYFLRGLDFLAYSDKAAVPGLNRNHLHQARISFPSYVGDQRAIAHILGTLDDKIDLIRRISETLEEITRALFKSWFENFDPVRAKVEGRDCGLPQSLTDLFPDAFEDSDLGEIPRGWSATPLYGIATYINGAAYKAFQPNNERRGLPIIKIAELKAGVTKQTKFSDVQMAEKYRIVEGDILFSWSGNPDTSIDTFVWSGGAAWLNQHIFRVLPNHHRERAFVLSTLKSLRPVFAEIARNKQTTGLGHVTAEDMKRLLVARPDDRVMLAWSKLASPLHERAYQASLEIALLSKIRDTLLPKLISGELRVEDPARFLGGGD